jgi:hypothetical protein
MSKGKDDSFVMPESEPATINRFEIPESATAETNWLEVAQGLSRRWIPSIGPHGVPREPGRRRRRIEPASEVAGRLRPAWTLSDAGVVNHILGAERLAKLRKRLVRLGKNARQRNSQVAELRAALSPEMFARLEIAHLFFRRGYSGQQISELTSKNINAVKTIIYRLLHPPQKAVSTLSRVGSEGTTLAKRQKKAAKAPSWFALYARIEGYAATLASFRSEAGDVVSLDHAALDRVAARFDDWQALLLTPKREDVSKILEIEKELGVLRLRLLATMRWCENRRLAECIGGRAVDTGILELVEVVELPEHLQAELDALPEGGRLIGK